MKQVIPIIRVPAVIPTVDFYCDVLGFKFMLGITRDEQQTVVSWDDETILDYALMQCGDVELVFQASNSPAHAMGTPPKHQSVSLFFETEDIDALYALLKEKGQIVKPLSVGLFGFREFYLQDCNGLVIGFGERV